MPVIEAIPGQGIVKTQSLRPEVEILTRQFERHDLLIALNPGFVPDAIFPYSFGIFAGAAIAGSISRETAFSLVQDRADIVRSAEARKPEQERSAMGVVVASRETIKTFLSQFPALHWTNDNGPGAHVLGGPVNELKQLAEAAGRRFRGILTAEGAYHSPLRQADAEIFREKLRAVPMQDPKIAIIPSTGNIKEIYSVRRLKEEMADSMVKQVNLEDIVLYWRQKGYDAVIDISQGATIQQLVTRFNSSFQFGSLEDEVDKLKEFFANIRSQLPNPNLALP